MPLIECKNVYAGYQDKSVLQSINFKVEKGDFIGVIGPNGGGKTTLVKLLAGILKPQKGILSYGFDGDLAYSVGYLPQYAEFDREFPISVYEVILSGLPMKGKGLSRYSKEQHGRVRDLILRLGLSDLTKRPVAGLSGGELQKVLLGRALISSPKVLILDEPNTYVDSRFEQELYQLLIEENKHRAIILVSHDIGMIFNQVKSIACVNGDLHYHPTSEISTEVLKSYNCPIDLITHGTVPHRVLKQH